MSDMRPITHEDYAEEAESAVRAGAWPQAAALYRKAAATCQDAGKVEAYEMQARRCDHEIEVDAALAVIARRVLGIPTLEERKSDRLDFHEVSAWGLKDALRQAFRAGHDAAQS